MSSISLKHLRYFDSLARLGHFGQAANACSISQPALSMKIKELETIIGAPLVERGTRQIYLTPLGENLANRSADILRSVEELDDLARLSKDPLVGKLRLGVIPTIAPYLLPKLIKRISIEYPLLDLHPQEAKTNKLITELLGSRLDIAILALPISEPGLHELPLFDEDFVLVRPADQADTPVPSRDQLKHERLLLLEEGHCFRDQALSFCDATTSKPRDLMEGSSLSTLVQMVGAGIGVTLIPEMAQSVEAKSADITLTKFEQPAPTRSIGMVWRKTNPLADHFSLFAEMVSAAR